MRYMVTLRLKMLMAFLSVLVGVVAQDNGLPAEPTVAGTVEKCEPATDYKFFIWRRIYQPCQYLCAGPFIAFENEDDGTACSTLLVPDGECLNGRCVDAIKTPEATDVPSTTTALVKDPSTTSESLGAEFQTAESISRDDAHVEDETEATEFTATESTPSGKRDEYENAAAEQAEVDEDNSAAP